jgi:hypothetical protein
MKLNGYVILRSECFVIDLAQLNRFFCLIFEPNLPCINIKSMFPVIITKQPLLEGLTRVEFAGN